VLWNVPSPVPAHPVAACRAALACAEATRALGASAWWRAAGLPPWRTRFGLHADTVLVGNFGAPDRLSYTAMGDGVNLAARLEGLNKVYGTTILVSQAIRDAAGDDFVFREIDRVAVKGKSRAVPIFELVGAAGAPHLSGQQPLIERYTAALAAARARRFQAALALLGAPECASDGPSQVLARRCQAWLATPPPTDWDGSWIATTK
jgi:adenylate cyclase